MGHEVGDGEFDFNVSNITLFVNKRVAIVSLKISVKDDYFGRYTFKLVYRTDTIRQLEMVDCAEQVLSTFTVFYIKYTNFDKQYDKDRDYTPLCVFRDQPIDVRIDIPYTTPFGVGPQYRIGVMLTDQRMFKYPNNDDASRYFVSLSNPNHPQNDNVHFKVLNIVEPNVTAKTNGYIDVKIDASRLETNGETYQSMLRVMRWTVFAPAPTEHYATYLTSIPITIADNIASTKKIDVKKGVVV
jgi:hypothetical protein